MKQIIPALLAALMLTGCSPNPPKVTSSGPMLYYISTEQHGPSIASEPYTGSKPPTPKVLLTALLESPVSEHLTTPFPAGLTVRSVRLDEGHLTVDFSEQYGGLTDIALTLADYCVVLTACQFDTVQSVSITVGGRDLEYRSHQNMTPEEASMFIDESQG